MNDRDSKGFAIFLIVSATMIFYILASGLVWLAYGMDGLQTMLLASGVIAVIALGVLAFILIQLAGAWQADRVMRNFIAAQQSNDNSDVEQMRVMREALRGDREATGYRAKSDFYDTQRVHRLADQRARLLMSPARQEPQTVDAWTVEDNEEETVYTEYD